MVVRHTEEGTVFQTVRTACAKALGWKIDQCVQDIMIGDFSMVVYVCQALFNLLR